MSAVDDLETVLAAVGDGGRTWQIARRLGGRWTSAKVRYRLDLLEAKGRVHRNPRYTYPNDIFWSLGPLPTPRLNAGERRVG